MASAQVRWYLKRSRGWDYLQYTSPLSLLLLYAAVFLLFSTIGFFTQLITGGHLPYASVLFGAFLSGLDAMLWIYFLSRRPLVWMAIPLAFSISIGFLQGAFTEWLSQSLHQGPVSPDAGIRFAAVCTLLAVLLSYTCFVAFIGRQGGESFKMRNELELAHGIQKMLVPPFTLRTAAFEIYGISKPSEKVGGDLVDAVALPGGNAITYVGDIAGHGLQAGILMGMLKTAARTALLAAEQSEPSRTLPSLLDQLNAVLPEVKEPHMYATFTAFRLGADGSVFYAMAASPPILHWHANQLALSKIEEEQYPLGLLPVSGFNGSAMSVCVGDLIAVATDGVFEACNQSAEEFGLERLERTIAASVEVPLPELAGKILDAAHAFGRQADDQTILLIRRIA